MDEIGAKYVLVDEEAFLAGLKRFQRELDKTGDEAEETGEDIEKMNRRVQRSGGSLRQTGRDLRTFGSALSAISPEAGKVTRLLGGFSTALAASASRGGATGLALTGVTLGLVGIIGVGVGATKALYDIAAEARETVEALTPFQNMEGLVPSIPESTLESFDRTSAAADALGTIASATGLAFAEEFAPELEGTATLAVALGLAIRDNVEDFAAWTRSMFEAAAGLDDLIERQGDFGRLLLAVGTAGLSEAVVSFGNYIEGVQGGETAVTDYVGEAEGLIRTQVEVNRSLDQGTKSARKMARALKDVRDEADGTADLIDSIFNSRSDSLLDEDKLLLAYSKELDAIDAAIKGTEDLALVEQARAEAGARHERDLAALQAQRLAEQTRLQAAWVDATLDGVAEVEAGIQEMNEAAEEAARELEDYYEDAARDARDSFIDSLADLGDAADLLAEKGVKGARALFRISQAAGIAQATIAAYTAYGQALALPLPPPLPQVAATAILGAGLANVATIAAQKPPDISTEHLGSGLIGARDPLDPSEHMAGNIRRLNGEISTPHGTINTQGANAVNQLNSGRIPDRGPVIATSSFKHLDRENERLMKNGRSRFDRMVRKRSRVRDPQRGW